MRIQSRRPRRQDVCVLLLALSAAPLAQSGTVSKSPYSAAARQYAEALLKYGRDHYGPVQTPMFVQMIDLRTLEIPKQRTAAEWRTEMEHWKEDKNYQLWGKDRSSVLWAQDSNLLWDTENIRLFYAMSKETGDARFSDAADQYVRYFLKHCVSRTTGLFAWGEHIAYNVLDDQIHGQRHELQHSAPLWDELWRLDPDAVQGEIEGVYRYHITDKRIMAYDRHANYWNGLPERDQATILGYAPTYVSAFSFLFEKTHEARYEDWARNLMLAFQSKSNAAGIYPDNWTEQQARELPYAFVPRPGVALGMYDAYSATRNSSWLGDANAYLEACERVFRSSDLKLEDRVSGEGALVVAALRGYEFTGQSKYLDLARWAADKILNRKQPHAQMASSLADSINVMRQLYEATGESHWLQGAQTLGDYAIAHFVHPSGLIRGTAIVDRPDYYDAIQGPGQLALALYKLGRLQTSATPMAPRHQLGDVEAPVIAELQVPTMANNRQRIPIKVKITDNSGVKRATLLYTFGNEVGHSDSDPEVRGDEYTFHIAPPGLNFLGDVNFAIEAVDASANVNRSLSPWSSFSMSAFEEAQPAQGRLPLTDLGLTLEGTEGSGSVGARMTRTLPSGTKAVSHGLVSVGRYVCFDQGPPKARSLVWSYVTEDTWRLIGSTLTAGYWDGSNWLASPSQLNTRTQTLTSDFKPARCWTLMGEDRVLWRADGRQGGVALADLNGDGTKDVATAFWQPGQLLSSRGQPIRTFAIDAPYHPLQNPSPPVIATLKPGDTPTVLFGAPAGYVYAYDQQGVLHWRTEVGGELLSGVAAGKLTDSSALNVVASWDGGIAVMDADGHLLWQKTVTTPSGTVPVLVDLEGTGKLDIVLNAGDAIVALRGDTGALLWSYSQPGVHFITPAAGTFVRGGRARVVTGDDMGTIYAIDEAGKLVWRQTRIYGPREVPEQIDQYTPISEIALADLEMQGERQIIATTKSGNTVALSARGERVWQFASYERRVGTSLARGGNLAFADLDNDGRLEVVIAQQDSYLYVLDSRGREKWAYRGYFWYHNSPSIADLQNTGELDIVFTAPENGGTYALRSGSKGAPGRAPWPMDRGNLSRSNCAPW